MTGGRLVSPVLFGELFTGFAQSNLLSPVLAGLIAARSIRAVFITGVVVLVILAIVVRRVMVERNPPIEPTPAVEE